MSEKGKEGVELEKLGKVKKEVVQKVTTWFMENKTIAGLLNSIAISTVCGHPCGMDSILEEISKNLNKKYGLNLNYDFYLEMSFLSDDLLEKIDVEKIKKDSIKNFTEKINNCKNIKNLALIVHLADKCKKNCPLKKFEALQKKLEEFLKKFGLEIYLNPETDFKYEKEIDFQTDYDHKIKIDYETDPNYQIEFKKIKKDLIEIFTNKIQEFKNISKIASLFHHGEFDKNLENCKLGCFMFDILFDNRIDEFNYAGLMLLEELEHVDLEKAKGDVIDTFTHIMNGCKTIKDLILLLYQEPCCGHPCGPSDLIMDILFENGIGEDQYEELMDELCPRPIEEEDAEEELDYDSEEKNTKNQD